MTRDPELHALARDDAERRVRQRLSRMAEHVERDRERERGTPLEPGIVARLEALCAAEDAPLEFRSIAGRVHDGRLTWEQFWEDPREHAGDLRLLDAVLRDLAANPPAVEPVEPPSDPPSGSR